MQRSSRQFRAGVWLICASLGGYILMHVFFFGVPRLTTTSALGITEIAYALANLALLGIGIHSVYHGPRRRRFTS